MFMLDLSRLPAPLHEAGTRFWQQFEQATTQHHLPLLRRVLNDQVSAEDFAQQLTRAFVGSEYLAKTCIQHPQLQSTAAELEHRIAAIAVELLDDDLSMLGE